MQVRIGSIGVEMDHVGEIFDGSQDEVRSLLRENGYGLAQKVGYDEIFAREDDDTFRLM